VIYTTLTILGPKFLVGVAPNTFTIRHIRFPSNLREFQITLLLATLQAEVLSIIEKMPTTDLLEYPSRESFFSTVYLHHQLMQPDFCFKWRFLNATSWNFLTWFQLVNMPLESSQIKYKLQGLYSSPSVLRTSVTNLQSQDLFVVCDKNVFRAQVCWVFGIPCCAPFLKCLECPQVVL